ncbi:MAG: hypothetical protein U0871_03125 [Gemmataceae bacterium]
MADQLRGGTEGGGVAMPTRPIDHGGTNSITPAGTSHDTGSSGGAGRGTRTDTRDDPEEILGDNSRHRSPSEAKQYARDEADVGTQPGTPHVSSPPRHHQIHPTEPGQPNGSKGDAPH